MKRNVILWQGQHLLEKEFVLTKLPASSYVNGTRLNSQGKTKHWGTVHVCGLEYLVYESLTDHSKKQIGDIRALAVESDLAVVRTETDQGYNPEIALILDFSYSQEKLWKQFLPKYQDKFYTAHEISIYIQMHSFIASIFGLRDEGYSLKSIFLTLQKLKKQRREKMQLYNFKVSSYKYFCDKLAKLEREGIENGVVNENRHKTKDTIINSGYVRKQIAKAYCQNKPVLTYQGIVDTVNHEIGKRNYGEVKLWMVKLICKEPEFQNRYKPFRLGKSWAEDNLHAFLVRRPVRFISDLWQVDGTCLPFYVLSNNKVTRFWYSIVIECFSRKIISYAVGHYETAQLIYHLYRGAVAATGCLPYEIVRDNAKAYDSQLIAELESSFEDLGCTIRPARVGNAQDKGTVEKVLDLVHCQHFSQLFPDCFIGDSWSSDREQYRLEPTNLKEFRKKQNAKSPGEILLMVEQAVARYNATIF